MQIIDWLIKIFKLFYRNMKFHFDYDNLYQTCMITFIKIV